MNGLIKNYQLVRPASISVVAPGGTNLRNFVGNQSFTGLKFYAGDTITLAAYAPCNTTNGLAFDLYASDGTLVAHITWTAVWQKRIVISVSSMTASTVTYIIARS